MTSPLTIDTSIDEITDNLSFLDDWEDRYGYIIELGRSLVPIDEDEQTDTNKVQGCVSQVWLVSRAQDGLIHYNGASDAHIVSGLVAITLSIFSGRSAREILEIDEQEIFKSIGLEEHLTPQRANGLRAMVAKIKSIAAHQSPS